ncbi:HIT family protein [Jeotgalibacillus proteolyticus]|uniref:HIT family protein n=1 Tax=Jeotgalibacillus proteolyticus TaxID=2082395 RepID=A0A2S5GHK6_9BACL|nr:HIT family protein [Jeotgalibacillus proteolyticus]PPA72404.1 HIT family protein [Jeotgalibacillus proteolyticus]
MSDCIFCKIINGEIPSSKVYEDEHVLAFLDISQVTKGHTLVIPKAHHENVHELTPEIAGHLFSVVPGITKALKKTYNLKGLNLLNNNGEYAGQSVFHFHLHILPRHGEEDGFKPGWETHMDAYSADDLRTIAKEISSAIEK